MIQLKAVRRVHRELRVKLTRFIVMYKDIFNYKAEFQPTQHASVHRDNVVGPRTHPCEFQGNLASIFMHLTRHGESLLTSTCPNLAG